MPEGRLTTLEKALGTLVSLGVLSAMLFGVVNYFMPKDLAQADHQAIVNSLTESHKQDRLERHDREIARLERDLRNPLFTEEERAFMVREIQRLELRKTCIHEGNC